MTLVDKEVGYELRCADPCAFDIDYTRSLGQAAVDFLIGGGTNAMITLQDNMTKVVPIPYDDMVDASSGRASTRMVNVNGIAYQSALKFQVRLEKADLEDDRRLQALATQTGKTPAEFKDYFGYLVGL